VHNRAIDGLRREVVKESQDVHDDWLAEQISSAERTETEVERHDDAHHVRSALLELPADSSLFADNQSRVAHRDELQGLIEQRLERRSVAEWIDVFAEHGVPAGEVKSLDRVYASAQVRDQNLVLDVSHTTLGEISLPGRPLRFEGSPLGEAAPPPVLGEHSEEVRARFQKAPDPASKHVA